MYGNSCKYSCIPAMKTSKSEFPSYVGDPRMRLAFSFAYCSSWTNLF